MANSLNKVMLMGNITRDIEVRHTTSNQAVATIGLAMNRKWKTPEGEAREEVIFVDCDAWGRTAEIIAQYFSKGKPIMIEGRLKLDQWDDKQTGKKQSRLKVVIENFFFVGGNKSDGGDGASGNASGGNWAPRQAAAPRQGSTATAPRSASSAPAPEPMGEDDIPF